MRRDPVQLEPVSEDEPVEGQFDASALARALWRRKRWIVLPTLLAAAVSLLVVNFVTPRYRSEARVLIESRETAYNRPDVERGGERERPPLDAEAMQSQVQLALSRDLARKIVRDTGLAENAEFNPEAGSLLGRLSSLIGLARDPSRLSLEERVLEKYYDHLSIYQVEKSRVIAIDFWSHDPDLAAKVANAVSEGFLAVQQTAKHDAMRQASQWLSREIEQLRGRVAEAEARVEEFRSRSNLYLGSNNNSLSAQQLAELNSQLVLARSQRAEADSKARLIRDMLRNGRPIEASEIANSELMRRLNEQRVTLRAQLAEQSSTLLDQHPRIKELKAQIGDLEGQIRTEAEKLVRNLENDARISGARVETLSGNLDQLKKQASDLGADDVQLRALEREAKAQRDLLESYLSRYRDATARETPEAVPPDARVVSRAVPSPTPYFPKKLPIVVLTALATMMGGVTFVGLGALLSSDYHRTTPRREVVRMPPSLPTAATVPVRTEPLVEPTRDPVSVAQAPRPPELSLKSRERRLAALTDHVRGLGGGVVIVSRVSDDRVASRVGIELARELAEAGERIVFLDLDAEAPNGKPSQDAGLMDLLAGKAAFGEVIHRDGRSPIHVIGVGRGASGTASILAAEKLAIVLGAVSQTYDRVILGVPPLRSLPGAERLARFARATILVEPEGSEHAPSEQEALARKGFANVAVVTVAPAETAPVPPPGRVAA